MTAADPAAPLTIAGHWDIPYQYAAGETATRFFAALRDREEILGTRCSACGRVLVPPRAFCERCFATCDDDVVVGPEADVVAFTITHRPVRGIDLDPPFVMSLLRLDGASTNLVHLVEGLDLTDPEAILDQVRTGLRVRARFHPPARRTGHILDIAAFEVMPAT